EIAELRLILDYLQRDPEVAGWKAKAHLAMKGSARPAEEKLNSGAWDSQFELFFAALCRRAGFVVALEEPDIVLRGGQGLIGLAAKRPHSLANFDKLIRRADEQIARSRHPGIIALDISYISSPDDM